MAAAHLVFGGVLDRHPKLEVCLPHSGGALPMLFPNALQLDPDYYAYQVLQKVRPPFWVNGQILRTPNFTWGNRIANAPPNIPFAGYLNKNATDDISISLTKVWGRHTIKGGFYNTHSFKAQQQQSAATFGNLTFSNDKSNPLDAQFGYANAILGVFSSYQQLSQYIEGSYVYNNTEGYVQDNWKPHPRATLNFGVRADFVPVALKAIGTRLKVWLPDEYATEPGVPVDAEVVPVPFRPSVHPNARELAAAQGRDWTD